MIKTPFYEYRVEAKMKPSNALTPQFGNRLTVTCLSQYAPQRCNTCFCESYATIVRNNNEHIADATQAGLITPPIDQPSTCDARFRINNHNDLRTGMLSFTGWLNYPTSCPPRTFDPPTRAEPLPRWPRPPAHLRFDPPT